MTIHGEPTNVKLNQSEAAELLGYAGITILSRLHHDGLPHHKDGHRVWYDRDELLAWRAVRMQSKPGHGGGRRTKSNMRDFDQAVFDIVQRQQPMTVRQVYYQAVVANLVPKDDAGYSKVQLALERMRHATIDDDLGNDCDEEIPRLPLEWIVDNSRPIYARSSFASPADAIKHAADNYNRDFWQDRNEQVYIWLEKDALASVVYSATHEYDVPVMVARGCNSISFAYQVAEMIEDHGRDTTIYYFRDLDPTGVVAPAALETLLDELLPNGPEVIVIECALTVAQIEEHGLAGTAQETKRKGNTHYPAFAAQYTADFARRGWLDEHGNPASFELDALPPNTLRELVRDAIREHVSDDEHREELDEQAEDRMEIRRIADDLGTAG